MIEDFIQLNNKYKSENIDSISRDYYNEYGAFTRTEYTNIFGSFSNFKKQALSKNDDNIIETEEEYNRQYFDNRKLVLENKGKYIITSVVAGSTIDKNVIKCLENYINKNDAKLILIPLRGIKISHQFTDSVLEYEEYIYTDVKLGKYLKAIEPYLSPQMQPLNQLEKIGKDFSLIVGSPKQQLQVVPSGKVDTPHILHSTGTITPVEYSNTKTGYVAQNEEVLGGLLVEIDTNGYYHIRQLVYDNRTKTICDLGTSYDTKGKINKSKTSIVAGDWHCGELDPSAVKATKEQIEYCNVNKIILHDAFNAISVNPHIRNNTVDKSLNYITLKDELDMTVKNITELTNKYKDKTIYIVYSNHNAFLKRYIQDGIYINDAPNYELALELALGMVKYKINDPFAYYLKKHCKNKNLICLEEDESLKINGVECGQHGHAGASGTRGTPNQMEKIYGNSITGHCHSPQLKNKTMIVGTNTYLDLSYTSGGNSWLHANALINENGTKQLLITYKGKWRI